MGQHPLQPAPGLSPNALRLRLGLAHRVLGLAVGVQLHRGHPVLQLNVAVRHGLQLAHLGLEPGQLLLGHRQLGLGLGQLPPQPGQRPGGLLQTGPGLGLLCGGAALGVLRTGQGGLQLRGPVLRLIQALLERLQILAVDGGSLLNVLLHILAVEAPQRRAEFLNDGGAFHISSLFLFYAAFFFTLPHFTPPDNPNSAAIPSPAPHGLPSKEKTP